MSGYLRATCGLTRRAFRRHFSPNDSGGSVLQLIRRDIRSFNHRVRRRGVDPKESNLFRRGGLASPILGPVYTSRVCVPSAKRERRGIKANRRERRTRCESWVCALAAERDSQRAEGSPEANLW